MTSFNTKKPIASFFLAIFLVSQLLLVGSFMMIPKPAKALFGIGDFTFTTEVGNVYDVLKDVGLAALRQVAINYANKFLTKFVDKLQDKYKIRNYLYYDKVLTDYYLNRYIADKVTDPDLRGIYSLLERGFISGAPTGATLGTGPDPRKALIPRLNKAISNYYLKKGGIDSTKIYNPSSFSSDREYFAAAQAYFSNPPSFTQQNLQAEFGAFQSSATAAAQLEILVGNGLKAGRIVGGVCKLPPSANLGEVTDPNSNPADCTKGGGKWQASALDQARSFIDNPTQFTAGWMDAAINQITGNNFDPNSYSAMIGSFIGNFIFNQLLLDRNSNDTLSDSPDQYQSDNTDLNPSGTPIDIDGDGITDGYDINNDGSPEICVYGGQPVDGIPANAGPPCQTSSGAANPEPPAPDCTQTPTALACSAPFQTNVVEQVIRYLAAQSVDTSGNCGAFEIVKRVAWALRSQGVGLLTTPHTTQCNGYSADVIAYTDNSGVDILGDAGVANTPTWQPLPPTTEAGVRYSPAQDPGDPSNACYLTMSCP